MGENGINVGTWTGPVTLDEIKAQLDRIEAMLGPVVELAQMFEAFKESPYASMLGMGQ